MDFLFMREQIPDPRAWPAGKRWMCTISDDTRVLPKHLQKDGMLSALSLFAMVLEIIPLAMPARSIRREAAARNYALDTVPAVMPVLWPAIDWKHRCWTTA